MPTLMSGDAPMGGSQAKYAQVAQDEGAKPLEVEAPSGPLGSGAPMLGYSCGMREINNLNARYSFLHLGKRCGRLLAGVKGHLWDEARRDAAASLDLVRAGEGENLSLSSIYTILHDMLSRLQGVAEVAASSSRTARKA